MNPPAHLEPVARDPGKLRRTAWFLVAIMLAGGWLVLMAYQKWAARQSADDRPAVIHRIRKERDLRIIRQDGKTADLFDLRGHVWAVHVMDLRDPQASPRSLAVMKRLAAKYSANPDFNLVTLAVNPVPAEQAVATLADSARAHGMNLPQWWLGTTEASTLHKFITNELKASVYPHEAGGVWTFDPSIVLIDREGHLRRAVVPQQRGGQPYVAAFDFDMAADWDREGRKSGTGLSNEAELELLLEKTITELLDANAR
jgi:cytochrome oxidase Cu insertion factor (SCO1/SenC/PrrC family)